jgi:hypothetical protein
MMILVIYDLTCKLYTHIVVRNPRPQSDINWDNWRGWLWCEDHMCSPSVNALLRYSIKRSTLIISSFPWGPAANRLVGQNICASFSLRARTTIYGTHAYNCLVLGCFIFIYLQLPMSHWFHELSYPCNARTSIPMLTVFSPTAYYCYYYRFYFVIVVTVFLLSPL